MLVPLVSIDLIDFDDYHSSLALPISVDPEYILRLLLLSKAGIPLECAHINRL